MTTIKQSVERQFSAVADAYRTSRVHAQGADLAQLVTLAALEPGQRVLDAGCGAGHAAAAAAPHVAEVVALDLSAAMLEATGRLAQARGLTNITLRRGDVEAIPEEDASFARVLSRYSAHHWPHPAQALREIRRVLAPGGRFVLADIVAPEGDTADSYLQMIELLRDPSHVRDRSPAQWRALFAASNLRVLHSEDFACPLDFGEWTQRMATPAPVVAVLRHMMQGAPAEVQHALRIEPEGNFTLPGALIVGEAA